MMPHVKIRVGILQAGIGLQAEVALIVRSQAGAGSVVECVAVSIRDSELQAMRWTLIEMYL
jgi:hypothetical protein